MSADRARLEAAQAELLAALQGRAPGPDRFHAEDLVAAARSLLRKRMAQVRSAWPALSHALGPRFAPEFERYARQCPPPPAGEGLVDGLAFARQLRAGPLGDGVRVELLLTGASFRLAQGQARRRRSPYLRAALLSKPRRLLLVWRLPWREARHRTIAIGAWPSDRRDEGRGRAI